MEKLLQQLADAESDLCWYLQHETFDGEKESKLRRECCQLRKLVALVTEALAIHGFNAISRQSWRTSERYFEMASLSGIIC
jgi:hypothetical protein